ncbi:hypothetical protein RRG08_028674 [Elysia crispata]|uniref:Uncharacterized protein n=1 Tax=Elysia crispata TaxID=231223 RepID=A0AAE0ZD64_9GAST|nr:hypothetical protein RRG08_028674 [Elysia crispata]
MIALFVMINYCLADWVLRHVARKSLTILITISTCCLSVPPLVWAGRLPISPQIRRTGERARRPCNPENHRNYSGLRFPSLTSTDECMIRLSGTGAPQTQSSELRVCCYFCVKLTKIQECVTFGAREMLAIVIVDNGHTYSDRQTDGLVAGVERRRSDLILTFARYKLCRQNVVDNPQGFFGAARQKSAAQTAGFPGRKIPTGLRANPVTERPSCRNATNKTPAPSGSGSSGKTWTFPEIISSRR